MSRFGLAFSCFYNLLFRGRLPIEAAEYLPEEALALPATAGEPLRALPPSRPAEALPGEEAPPPPRAAPPPKAGEAQSRTEGALMLLGLLQREGRLVDFLRESLDSYDDAAIGAAVRDVHRGCKKVLDEHLRLEPVMPGQEEAPVTVPRGFDPGEVRLIGKVDGEPPFRGVLVHHGWRAVDSKFPALSEGVDRRVLAPAEVRVAQG